MQLAHIYVNYPGTAEEAFVYYEKIFKTKVARKVTFGETTFIPNVPPAIASKIMHIEMPLTDKVMLMGSDSIEGFGPPSQTGNNFHIAIVASSKEEADEAFAALSDGGSVTMPIANAPWGTYFGMCMDRFGIHWMVSLPHAV